MYFNQLGYYPSSTKIALVAGNDASHFSILRNETSVFEERLSEAQYWEDAGEQYRLADFSALESEGVYRLQVGNEVSEPFSISNHILQKVARATVKALFYQRASTALREEHAGKWARPFGHPDDTCLYHPSTGKPEGLHASPGGWYDAGDYGKYTVPVAYTSYRLLSLYERFPHVYCDGSLGIPESGNGQNDLLDEIKVGLDWLHTMQDEDGSVFHKLTTLNFEPEHVMPHQAVDQRYIIGKSTKATLDFSANLAQASRVFKESDPEFAKRSLSRAEQAWQWAIEHPNVNFENPDDVNTGEYEGAASGDEFFWAAVELFIATQKSEYRDVVEAYDAKPHIGDSAAWDSVKMHGIFSMLQNPKLFEHQTIELLRKDFLLYADQISQQIEQSPARIDSSIFNWGSNGYKAFRGVALIEAFRLSREKRYLLAAGEIADYLLGKNPVGYSFITGFGTKQLKNIHHRLSIADGIEDLIPGLLSGGPNGGQQDNKWVKYPSDYPAKSFVDDVKSYASNEITTYWNAEAAFLFCALETEHMNS